jgi:transcription initiation factor TFIIB
MNAISNDNDRTEECPECAGKLVPVHRSGDVVCGQCGLIIRERALDYLHSGKRAFTKEERASRERTGSPISPLTPDIGLSTVLNKSEIKNQDLKRAAKWDTRIPWNKRNLLIASTELKRISSNLNIPNYVRNEAFKYYKAAFKKKLLKGRSINGMVAASLYYALRKKRIPRTLQEITDESNESAREVRRCYRALIKELNLKVPTRKPSTLIPRYIAELGWSGELESAAIKIVKTFTSNFPTSGKDPKGICAGALYLVGKFKKIETATQKDIANLVGVTEVTLRSRYKELKKKLNIKLKKP